MTDVHWRRLQNGEGACAVVPVTGYGMSPHPACPVLFLRPLSEQLKFQFFFSPALCNLRLKRDSIMQGYRSFDLAVVTDSLEITLFVDTSVTAAESPVLRH